MPRYKKLEDSEFTTKMREEFKTSKNTFELSKVMGLNKKTCQRYLKDLDLHYPKGRPKGGNSTNRKNGGLAKWIRSHPGETLPLKVSDIIEQTGLTKDQVKSFLYRMKMTHSKRLKKLGDIREYKGGLKGTKGTIILFSDIKEYSIKHSFLNENLNIHALLGNKKRIAFETTLGKLEKYERLH